MTVATVNPLFVWTFALGISLLLGAVALVFLYRRDEYSVFQLFMKGSFVFRDLEGYVRPQAIHLIKALAYTGALVVIGALVILWTWG